MTETVSHLRRIHIFQYSALAMPLAFAGMPLYIYAPDYYATQFSVSLTSLGLILLALRFIDAIQDPLIGYLCDLFSSKRFALIMASEILLCASFSALFFPPSRPILLIWFTVAVFLGTSAFSIISINLNTLGGLWSKDTFQKTRITSAREALSLFGLLLAATLPAFLQLYVSKQTSFLFISGLLTSLMLLAHLLFYLWQKTQSVSQPIIQAKKQSFVLNLKNISLETKFFFLSYFVSMLASSMPAVLVLFFIRDRLNAEHFTGIFLLLYFVAGASGLLLWQGLAKRSNKLCAWLTAMMLAVLSFFWAFFLNAGDVWQFALICIFSGIAFGADLSLPPSILADHIQNHKNERSASFQFGIFGFLSKAAFAIASAVVFLQLDFSGFRAAEQNSNSALFVLSMNYAAIPCVIKLCACALLWHTMTITRHGNK